MDKLILILIAAGALVILYILQRMYVFYQDFKVVAAKQVELIKLERELWNRYSLLVNLLDPVAAGNELLMTRSTVYFTPSELNFVEFIEEIIDSSWIEMSQETLELGLKSELEGKVNLVQQRWDDLHSSLEALQVRLNEWPLRPFGFLKRKGLAEVLNFQG